MSMLLRSISTFHNLIVLDLYASSASIFPLNIMLRVSFLLAVIVLVVIVGFALFGPPRENGYCSFATNPFLSPWQETFDDAGDGDGGDHLGPFGIILGPF